MKSLYNVLQESIFDDNDEILDKIEFKSIIDNIINSNSPKEYDSNILVLKDHLDKIGSCCVPGKKPRFLQNKYSYIIIGGTSIIDNPYHHPWRTKFSKSIPHPFVIITKPNMVPYEIYAFHNHDFWSDIIRAKQCEFKDVKKCIATQLYDAEYYRYKSDDIYVYKVDNSNMEGIYDYMDQIVVDKWHGIQKGFKKN
jgi:hypothetical protein